MNKKKIKDIAVRAFKTFWQAAIGYALTAIASLGVTDLDTMKTVVGGIIASAIAAGASAAWNGVVTPLIKCETKNE